MSPDYEHLGARRLPSLVHYCQRVASAHVESICSLSEDVPLELVRPVLQNCSAETLLRLEQTTPSLSDDTAELWKSLCFRAYPLTAEQHYTDTNPVSWRDAYFDLREWEKQRLEAVGNKLRSQREELEQRRKDSQVKFTDRLPPVKRSRGWVPTAPKTLFQKTRSDAVKMQKGIYGARVPAPPVKMSRALKAPSAMMPKPSSAVSSNVSSANPTGTRVTVTAVPRKPPPPQPLVNPPSSIVTVPSKSVSELPTPKTFSSTRPSVVSPSLSRVNEIAHSPEDTQPVSLKPPPVRKDPMATIFMPKHRSYSQLPTAATGMRSRA